MSFSAFKSHWEMRKSTYKSIAWDLWGSFVEALIVMLIIHVPLALRIVWILIGNDQSELEGKGFVDVLASNYRTADIIVFSTGLLASSTA